MATANIRAVITAEDRASAALKGFGNNVDSVGRKISRVMKVAAVVAGVALAGGIYKAAKASWDQVDAVQQATVGLKAYEKNTGKVNAVLRNLISYAQSDLGVLFNRKDLFKSAQSLKIMGDNTDQLVDHVKILSRSVGLGLSNWEDLNLIVGRVGSTGRLTGEDFDNLTKAGFRLDDKLRNTDITFNKLFMALDKGIPITALEGQANTIQGLSIRLGTAFRGVGDAVLGVDAKTNQFIAGGLGARLVQALSTATTMLRNLKLPLASLTQGFIEATSKIIALASRLISFLTPSLRALWSTISSQLIPVLTRLWKEIIVPLAPVMGRVLAGALWILVNVLNVVISAVSRLIGRFLAVAGAIRGFIGWIRSAIGWLGSIYGKLSQGGAWSSFLSAARRALGPVGTIISSIISLVDNLIGKIQSAISAAGGAKASVGNSLKRSLIGALPGFAVGTNFAPGGPAIVGERGPELVNLPRGSQVIPTNELGRGSGNTINFHVNVGMYLGTEMEKRKIAKTLFDAYDDLVKANLVRART